MFVSTATACGAHPKRLRLQPFYMENISKEKQNDGIEKNAPKRKKKCQY